MDGRTGGVSDRITNRPTEWRARPVMEMHLKTESHSGLFFFICVSFELNIENAPELIHVYIVLVARRKKLSE